MFLGIKVILCYTNAHGGGAGCRGIGGKGIKMETDKIREKRVQGMAEEAMHELLHYYDKDRKRKWKDRLKKAAGRYVPPEDGIFWDTGLLANGLMEMQRDGKDTEGKILSAVRQYFDRWIDRGMPVYYMDDTLCGVALLRLYEAVPDERYRKGADRLADYLLFLGQKEADAAGSIPYRPAQKNGHIYVDGIGMMCPFLTMYGVKYGNRKAVELALLQIKNMLEHGMDGKTGLPYHGFRYDTHEKYGIIGWGRAVGWLLTGMQGTLYWLQEGLAEQAAAGHAGQDCGEREGSTEAWYRRDCEQLKTEFLKLLEAVRDYQRTDGGFSWQLEALEGPADSSATAMIARAFRFGAGCGFHGEEALCQAEGFLWECEKDGRIYRCLGECMGFSQYPQVYGAFPWSLGTALGILEGCAGKGKPAEGVDAGMGI